MKMFHLGKMERGGGGVAFTAHNKHLMFSVIYNTIRCLQY
ncbi:hypothetical protein MTBPR1_190014 [Candidatus Terasakiella magnetica]|uniref:Uncharacterized protein n=1 Tax=Candidatus Terasakiella magnetica TaxID=1867952 RepID=A0A1C3RFR0_9PROT|nr:hypothetical protein MTBPR1_190014 [Candidatus Terasakiella magnetica]